MAQEAKNEVQSDHSTKGYNLSKLEKLYTDGTSADRHIFAKMRSNVLLAMGQHYSKRRTKLYTTLRDPRDLNDRERLRLVKNHTHRVVRHYEENILSLTPNVKPFPVNDTEIQDVKAAELMGLVWKNRIRPAIKFDSLRERLASHYVQLGEIAAKIFWDPKAGKFKGYAQQVDELGQPMMDDQGFPIADESSPEFEGDFVCEEILAYNLFREAGIKSFDEAEGLGLRKMVKINYLKELYGANDPRVEKLVNEREDFIIFDVERNEYLSIKDSVVWKEYFIRPCLEYPEGYYYMWTTTGIFEEGILPLGIFPIIIETMENYPGTPRGRSAPLEIGRPYQAEINRAGSAMAMAQITLGDDKLLINGNARVSPGMNLPGVRTIKYIGAEPIILPGRDGSQYRQYIIDQINEYYQAVMLDEEGMDKSPPKGDVWAVLLRSMRQKKKFAKYQVRFQRFLISLCDISLQIAQKYMEDKDVIRAIGRPEIVNIEEFRGIDQLRFQVRLEESNDDVESKTAAHLTLMQALQYVGKQLSREDIGKIMKQFPFVDLHEAFGDMTIDQELGDNMILALDRGQTPRVNNLDNHEYMIRRLDRRISQSDFTFLDPQIQQMYEQVKEQHQQVMVEQLRQLKATQSEFIPIEGPLVKADVYVADPSKPDKQPQRAQIPQRALEWLLQRLEDQNGSMDKVLQMNKESLSQMAEMYGMNQPGPQAPPQLPQQTGV